MRHSWYFQTLLTTSSLAAMPNKERKAIVIQQIEVYIELYVQKENSGIQEL